MEYDAAGNLVQVSHDRVGTVSDHTECFSYDARARLLSAYTVSVGGCAGTGSLGGPGAYDDVYVTDEIGNLTQGPAGGYVYPVSGAGVDRPHAPTVAGGVAMVWNGDGTLASRTAGGVSSVFSWDAFNRLTQVSAVSGDQAMVYGAGGERVLMKDSAGVHLYLGGLAERHVAGGVTTNKRYYSIGSVMVAARSKVGAAAPAVEYLLGDVRGSVAMTVTAGAATTMEQWYSPYGKVRAGDTTAVTSRGYIGQHQDQTTGLNYLNNRYQDPATGVFLSVDPMVAVTGEPYLYGAGNPATLSDPSGLDPDTTESHLVVGFQA